MMTGWLVSGIVYDRELEQRSDLGPFLLRHQLHGTRSLVVKSAAIVMDISALADDPHFYWADLPHCGIVKVLGLPSSAYIV